jgi:polar amino acid transport system permease protein
MPATHLNIYHLEFLAWGAMWTIGLSLMAFIGGGLAGFGIALCRVSPSRILRAASGCYVQLIQGTPLLVILFLGYFGLPAIGVPVQPIVAAAIGLTIYVGAFLGETWRGCINAIPGPQWEAAECLALTRTQRMFHVILPQAIRIATPPTVGFMVQIIKSTSLASTIGFIELARAGQIINNSLFKPFLIYVIIAAVYFAMCYPISRISRRLERPGSFRRRELATP